jgi:uncharacterized protein
VVLCFYDLLLVEASTDTVTALPTCARLVGVRVAVLSDTHAPRRWHGCPPAVAAVLEHCELILHAGDVCTAQVLTELAQWAPVHAVLGNNDGPDVRDWGAAETLLLDVAGLSVAMIHDSGPAVGRASRLRRRFPDAGLVIFGHSHIPWDERVPWDKSAAGQRLFNPGSPTDRRRQPRGTMGLLDVRDGELVSCQLVAVT